MAGSDGGRAAFIGRHTLAEADELVSRTSVERLITYLPPAHAARLAHVLSEFTIQNVPLDAAIVLAKVADLASERGRSPVPQSIEGARVFALIAGGTGGEGFEG